MQEEKLSDADQRAKILYDLCIKMLKDYDAEASDALKIAMNIVTNIAIINGWTREHWNFVNENFIEMIFGED